MMNRREFCIGLCAATAVTAACRDRILRLKVPEDADECADLFKFFTDPAFGFEQAMAGLGIIGEPHMQDLKSRLIFQFEDQGELVERISLETKPIESPGKFELTSIYIDYKRPISISLQGLQSYLGSSSERNKMVPAEMSLPVAMFTNLRPGQKERSLSTHSFYPDKPIAAGHLKGELWFRCETTAWDTKRVESLSLRRICPSRKNA